MIDARAKCHGCKSPIAQSKIRQHVEQCTKIPKLPSSIAQKTSINTQMSFAQLNMFVSSIEQQQMQISAVLQENFHDDQDVSNIFTSKLRSSNKKINEADRSVLKKDEVYCRRCNKKFYYSIDGSSLFYVGECWHTFCKSCIAKYITQSFVEMEGKVSCPVPSCNKQIDHHSIQKLLGSKKYDDLNSKAIRKTFNIIQCIKCKMQFEFIPGKIDSAPEKQPTGQSMKSEQKLHYVNNRFICYEPNCKLQQCKSCQITPYHIGFTCDQYKQRAKMKKCRYCEEPIIAIKLDDQVEKDICDQQECQDASKRACTKIKKCGHHCGGFLNQKECLPCLREPCCDQNKDLHGQNGEDYCNICFIEALNASPCVRSSCGHIFHEKCLQKRFLIKWITPRINFNFCLCPLCKQWLQVPNEHPLSSNIEENMKLCEKIEKMAQERLKYEGLEKDNRLTDSTSPYYKKPKEYAMAIFAYFLCFKCKNPYFGGRQQCANRMNEPQEDFNPEQLICAKCCDIPTQNCPKHGKQFLEFKCKFCCSIAQYFCWGSTHFCKKCHKRQNAGDYMTKYKLDQLPICPGPKKCPIGGNHKKNGMSQCLGCTVCRNLKENMQNF